MAEEPLDPFGDRPYAAELDPAATPAHKGGRFLVLDNVEIHKTGPRVTCIAKLKRAGQIHRGEATELDSTIGRVRAAARATLAAATQVVDTVSFGLEGIALTDFFSRRYVVVSIEAAQRRRFIILSGIVALDAARSNEEAAALAVLRAIDRWIST